MVEIEDEVDDVLRSVMSDADKRGLKDEQWTYSIREALTDLGRRYGYQVCGARPKDEHFEREWLCDLTWKQLRDGSSSEIVELPLAVESEWTWDEQLWDFQKLLALRAGLRVMIFQAGSATTAEDYFTKLQRAIASYDGSRPGDRYLFVCWNFGNAERQVMVRRHVVS